MATKKADELTLKDRLSRLTYKQAHKLLGEKADRLLAVGGALSIDIDEQVVLDDHHFRLDLNDAVVTIMLSKAHRRRLEIECSNCSGTCDHIGAALSLILEEKMVLGLSRQRLEDMPLGLLSEEEVVDRAIADRVKRAAEEKMRVQSCEPKILWTDYLVTNSSSGRAYRVALRGWEPGESYCSCPDFKKNTLGTCKHILRVQNTVRRRFKVAIRNRAYVRETFTVGLVYKSKIELRLHVPQKMDEDEAAIAGPVAHRPIVDISDLLARVGRLEALGCEVAVYPDAEEYVQKRLLLNRIEKVADEIRSDSASHPLRKGLLKVELLPYQLEGIAFAAKTGRAILADDMGLGKTIQGIGLAELLAIEGAVSKVLVVCPASLKAQWRSEINRFSGRTCQLVLGRSDERGRHYRGDAFFTICNYEQVLRDMQLIEEVEWDLIILDEGQRIKNWETQTSRAIKALRSPFALVLSGTPLENRLDDLFSVVEFVDDRRLGPAFRFFNRHRIVDEKGKVLGFRELDDLRKNLAPVFLRRTRSSVMEDLPARSTEIIRVTPTEEQLDIHGAHMRVVNQIVRKPYLNEMDMLRLRKALLMCRMVANSTFLVTKEPPGYSSKMEALDSLLSRLAAEEDRKIVLFSEWTTMLGLIELLLEKNGLEYVRLDGSVPQKKRLGLVHQFQDNPKCRVFISTNAGSTGLNLQAANTVINVDLPWNPAVLEQRISRAHRMGQKSPVQVFIFVTEETLEENLLGTLSAKNQLALAALDLNSDVDTVELTSGIEELKRRLEVLLGAKPEASVDASQQKNTEEETRVIEQRQRVSLAGGQLLSAAFSFLGEIIPRSQATAENDMFAARIKESLAQCLERDDQDRPVLTVTLPDPAVLDSLANTLSSMMPKA
ncbi:MAG: DEAD/DEAH box helicase [Deltaproteobacteria bacterium]|nr:DEAD/DEAH box helicase [Deltaproteobacteria bacterium]